MNEKHASQCPRRWGHVSVSLSAILFIRECSARTRGNGYKLKEGRFRLGIRKKFFTVGVVRPWPRLPREMVNATTLAVFKLRLDRALSNLV